MMRDSDVTADGRTITVRIPISIRKRGGRKLILAPDGTSETWTSPCRRIDSAMVKAIARAFRWREMLENGTYATIAEIAVAEMGCDWNARSQEFGTGLRQWINEEAVCRFSIDVQGERYRWIQTFVGLLLESAFVPNQPV